MNRTVISWLVVLLWLPPSAALAGSWSDLNLVRGETTFWETQDATDPARLKTSKCGRSSWVRLVPDITDDTGAASNGITANVYACEQFDGTGAAGCRQLYDNFFETGTLDGVSATSTAVFYGSLGSWVYINILTGPTSGTARFAVGCQ